MLNTMQAKDDSKTVALGTSEDQLHGPAHHRGLVQEEGGAHREDIQQKSLLAKFPWALEVPSTWTF